MGGLQPDLEPRSGTTHGVGWRRTMTHTLGLREGDPPRLVEFPRPVADALAGAGVVQVGVTERPGWWEVTPGTQVGVVSVGRWQLVVQPKIDINRRVFLMGYARNPSWWREDRVVLDADADLPEALTDAFVRHRAGLQRLRMQWRTCPRRRGEGGGRCGWRTG